MTQDIEEIMLKIKEMRDKGISITDPEAKLIIALQESKSREQVANIEAKTAKRDRICTYVTSGLDLVVKVGTAVCSVLIFAAGIEYEKTGSYTSPFTKAMAQNAMRRF